MSIIRCTKCNGQMERGFVVDVTHGGVLPAKWAEGAANYSKWWGIRDLKKRRKYAIIADRCVKCGFLEHYATEETR